LPFNIGNQIVTCKGEFFIRFVRYASRPANMLEANMLEANMLEAAVMLRDKAQHGTG
jgi:hypothetical protein